MKKTIFNSNGASICSILLGVTVILFSIYFGSRFNEIATNVEIYHKSWVLVVGSFTIFAGMALIWLASPQTSSKILELLLSIVFATWYFVIFNSDKTIDDGGIVLKYLDNAAVGHFFVYNISDGRVWGISGFLHGLLCNLIAMLRIFSPYNSMMFANFLELIFLGWAMFSLVSNYSTERFVKYLLWFGGIFFTTKLMICSKQGLETPFHLGIILLTLHVFINRVNNERALIFLWVLCLISKLDSLPIVAIMVVWFCIENHKRFLKGERNLFLNILLFGILPGIAWLVISYLLFQGPIPQTAIAKQFSKHTWGPGWEFIKIFFFNRPKVWLIIILTIILGAYTWKSMRRKGIATINIDAYVLPILMLIGYLALYYFYNPKEAMIWYYVIPDFFLLFIVMISIVLILEYLTTQLFQLRIIYKRLLILAVFVLAIIIKGHGLAQQIGAFWCVRTIQEDALKAVGRYIMTNAAITDTLITQHGYVARESKLYVVDFSGLNFKPATDLKFDYFKLISEYRPQWITDLDSFESLCHGNKSQIEALNKDYTLVKTFELDYRLPLLDFPYVKEYKIWKRKQ